MPTPTITFEVTATDGTTTAFTVAALEGEERVSQPFEYRLTLRYDDANLDFSTVVNQKAVLTMKQDAKATPPVPTEVKVEGVVASFRITRQFDDGDVECEAVLVPKLWRLGMFHGSRIFQGLAAWEIVERVFEEEVRDGAPALKKTDDYLLKLADPSAYPVREFAMQYRESHLDFVQRLLEHDGIYYYFDGGTLILSDSRTTEHPVAGRREVTFYEATGAMTPADDQVYRFIYNEQVIPQAVSLRDYDFGSFEHEEGVNKPIMDVAANKGDYARVGTYHDHGRYAVDDKTWAGKKSGDNGEGASTGPVRTPGGGVKGGISLNANAPTPAEAAAGRRKAQMERIALVRAEEIEARRQVVEAVSSASRIRAGHVFTLKGHWRSGFDGDYFVTGVRHSYDGTTYYNEFTCIPASVQFRPPRVTPVPRVPGIMTAKVKGTAPPPDRGRGPLPLPSEDEPAYIDDEGRYRVRFPFGSPPQNGAHITEPSGPLRMAQPYAGSDYGLHFPNRHDAEMVFACLDGDPDRPLGLSVVPNPWRHSPVPDTALELGSQNPTTGSATGKGTTFENTKNVIRTQRGHQLVMDDGDAGSNVGITLQVGTAKNKAGRDIYWGSKVELGGYRHLSTLERVLGIASTAVGYFRSAFTRDFPGMASEALGILASQVTTDDYVDDTYGTTTPIGVNIWTNKNVNVTGKDGVNITSPNLFGMFSTSLFNGDDDSKNQYQAEAISKFIINTVWQEVIDGTADEIMESHEETQEYAKNKYKNPKIASTFKWKENFKEQRISALIFTLLQRTGVNISSMGELKLTSLQSTSVAAGQGGLALKSFGPIEQKADLGVEISSHEGIKISTKGRPYKGKGVFKVLRKLGDALPTPGLKAFMGQIQSRFSNVSLDPNEMFPIEINNEDGDILLHTGGAEQKGEGDIMAHVEGKGDIKTFVNEGQVHAWSGGEKGIYLEVGSRSGSDNDPLAKEDATGVIWLNNDELQGFSARKVQLYVGADYTKKTDSAITVEEGKILIKCGQSSIEMKKDGTITLEGKDITMKGSGNIKVEGTQIASKAQSKHSVEGAHVDVKARGIAKLEGQGVNVKATLATIKGSMTKIG